MRYLANDNSQELQCIVSIQRDVDILVAAKPTRVKNEIGKSFTYKHGKLVVQSERYKTRVMRPSSNQARSVLFDWETCADFPF